MRLVLSLCAIFVVLFNCKNYETSCQWLVKNMCTIILVSIIVIVVQTFKIISLQYWTCLSKYWFLYLLKNLFSVARTRKTSLWRRRYIFHEDSKWPYRDGWGIIPGWVFRGTSSPSQSSWHGNKDKKLLQKGKLKSIWTYKYVQMISCPSLFFFSFLVLI